MAQFHPFDEVVFVVYPQGITVEVRGFDDPVLQKSIATDAVGHGFGATTYVEVVVLDVRIAKYFILPIGTRAKSVGIGVGRFATSIGVKFIDQSGIFRTSGQIYFFGNLLDAIVCIETKAGLLAANAFAGGDQHDAIGAPSTINCGRGSIFEDFDVLDVAGVEKVNVVENEAVNNVDGVGIIQSACAPDADDRTFARATRSRTYIYPCNFTLQCLGYVGSGYFLEFRGFDGTYRASQITFALGTITHHYDFVDH